VIDLNVLAPINGRVYELDTLHDFVFAEKVLGDGLSIFSEEEVQDVCSPMDGVIKSIFPTNHAFIVENGNKSLLIHIGVDTIELKGRCFKRIAEEGQRVNAGDPIIRTDFGMIKRANLDSNVIVVCPEGTVNKKTTNSKTECGITLLFEI